MEITLFFILFVIWLVSFLLAIVKDMPELMILAMVLSFGLGITINTGIEKYYCFGFENIQNDTTDNTIECKKLIITNVPMAYFFYLFGFVQMVMSFVAIARNLKGG